MTLSANEIDDEIMRISQRLDKQVTVLAKRARAAAEADVEWKIAHAKAILTTEGATVGEREAKALLACEDVYRAHKAADAVLLAAQEAGRSLRSQADALRTLATSQRAALTYTEGTGG